METGSCVWCSALVEGNECMMDSCSRRNSCGGFIVCDETACSAWEVCEGLRVDKGTSRATGCGGVSEAAGARGSGSLEEAVPA